MGALFRGESAGDVRWTRLPVEHGVDYHYDYSELRNGGTYAIDGIVVS